MRKVYKINGKTEVHLVLESPSGKTKYRIAFTKGSLDPKMLAPATYSTSDPVMQDVIERDKLFGKVIFLDKVYGEVVPTPAATQAPKKGKAKTSDVKVMEDVKTIADAVTALIAAGASAADIDGSIDGAKKVAKNYGITFPNLKAE